MNLRHIAAAALAVFVAACSSNDTTNNNGSGGTPAAVNSFSGNAQASIPGATLFSPLIVKVTDANGAPVAGVQVTWTVTAGGGTVTPSTSITDSTGRATTSFTLGAAGAQSVRANVASLPTSVTFTATATSSTPVSNITLVTSVPMPTGATFHHDTFVRDGLAFVCAWNKGVLIYDVGNGMKGGSPANPQLVSQLITSANNLAAGPSVHNAWWFHNPVTGQNKYLFIGQEGPGAIGTASSGDIHIVDVSDLNNPVEVGFIHIAGAGVHNFWMDEANQILYAAYYNAGVVKIDVSGTLTGDMSSRIVAQVRPGGAGNTYIWGVMLSGGTLYATDMLSGFWALDPATLATRGGGNNVPERYGSDQWVHGTVAYSGGWGRRNGIAGNAVKIWNLGIDGGPPTLVDSIVIANVTTISDVAVTPDGKMLVVTAEGGGGNGLYVFSRANAFKPTLVGTFLVAQGLHTGEVAVINGRTYVFAARDPSQQQMDIFDITGLAP